MRSAAKRTGMYLCGNWLSGLSAWILDELPQQNHKPIQVELKMAKLPQVC